MYCQPLVLQDWQRFIVIQDVPSYIAIFLLREETSMLFS